MTRTHIDFGIDLGTTNSLIAKIEGVGARMIQNRNGALMTPSAVAIDKRGRIHVGQDAKLRALGTDPDNADAEFKLRMGLGEDGRKRFSRSGRSMKPEELSAEVLKSLRRDVESQLDEELRAAVITVPAAFENPQMSATRRAAELAGFELAPMLLEPVAASLACGFQERRSAYWLVYDFGGGTFDAAVMRLRDGRVTVVEHDGDNFLGGKLIDWDIIEGHVVPLLRKQFDLPDLSRANPRWGHLLSRLKYHVEQAKIEVCRSREACELYVEDLGEDASGRPVDLAMTLTPQVLRDVTRPHVERSLALVDRTLKNAGIDNGGLDEVVMVGGTTLNPWVREAVRERLSCELEVSVDPLTAVAQGAAIFASIQPLPSHLRAPTPQGAAEVEIIHQPVGQVVDPDIGGRVRAPNGASVAGYTIEFVDDRTGASAGRVPLDASGAFMTTLVAEEERRCEFVIQLRDARGTRVPCAPDRVAYTIGVVPDERPPAATSIGIGLANNSMHPYVARGDRLPASRMIAHITTVHLRAGVASDELRIPLLEGEHRKATRNHPVGEIVIRGTDVPRDIPIGTELEVSVSMDTSQQIRVEAYVRLLDETFEEVFAPQMQSFTAKELEDELEAQKTRLDALIASQIPGVSTAARALRDDRRDLENIVTLVRSARNDGDARTEADRRLRELAAEMDELEDVAELPKLAAAATRARREAADTVARFGTDEHRRRLRDLEGELSRAEAAKDPDALARCREDLDALDVGVLHEQPSYHAARFDWLVGRKSDMTDAARAGELFERGRRAVERADVDALKTVNRQLASLLPRGSETEADDRRIGHTLTAK